MSARFRYLAPDGAEVQIGSTDALLRAFLSGEIAGDTLVFDAEGDGWAPARTHSSLLGVALPDVAFTLVEEDAGPTREEVIRTLDLERRREGGGDDVPPAPSRSVGLAPSAPPADERRPLPTPLARSAPERPVPAPLAPRRRRRPAALLGAITTALGTLAATLILLVLLGDPVPGRAAPSGQGAGGSTPAETQAFADVLAELEGLQAGLGADRIPEVWLEGAYLADAGRHGEVAAFWTGYGTWVEEARLREAELFRAALSQRLQAEGLTPAQLSLRVAGGIRAFEADRPRREAVYEAFAEVSRSALSLHRMLVANAGRIAYEPAEAGISRQPVTEAVADTPELGAALDRQLDEVLQALERASGEQAISRSDFPGALRRGLERAAAVARGPMS